MRLFAAALACVCALSIVSDSAARGRKKAAAVMDPDWKNAPSTRYADLSKTSCHAELQKRKITFQAVEKARGVLAPVRIPDGIEGVIYRTALPPKKGRTSPWEVFDCRLVLALHDFTQILKKHDIEEVRIFSSWRPPRKSWPEDKLAKRHPGALAIDIRRFRKRTAEGQEPRWLNVEHDFHGKIGHTTCGAKATEPSPTTPAATELRTIVCEAAKQRLFTSILTPHYDRAHHNHFHFDLAVGAKWRIVR